MNEELHTLNEKVVCAGLDRFFWTGLLQPIWPYTSQLANMFSIELSQQGRTVIHV